jgi:hypothetical protein
MPPKSLGARKLWHKLLPTKILLTEQHLRPTGSGRPVWLGSSVFHIGRRSGAGAVGATVEMTADPPYRGQSPGIDSVRKWARSLELHTQSYANVCRSPAAINSKALSYSFPQTSHLSIAGPLIPQPQNTTSAHKLDLGWISDVVWGRGFIQSDCLALLVTQSDRKAYIHVVDARRQL